MTGGEEADGGGVRVGEEKVARRAVSRAWCRVESPEKG